MMRKIPLCIPATGEEEIRAVSEVLSSGWLAHGPKNHEFEQMFGAYVGAKHAITMNSCTSALHLAVEALELTGEVIVPSFTWVASVNAILLAGARPVMVDVDVDTRNVSVSAIEAAITRDTRAIMAVHYGGLPADMPRIIDLARKHGLRIIEDSAECLGGTYGGGTKTGAYDIGCFSFFPTKNITTGEGGMFTTNDDDLAKKVRALSAHGIDSSTYERELKKQPWLRMASRLGYNFRMSNVLAAIGIEQMRKLDKLNAARQFVADRYIDRLKDCDHVRFQRVPTGFVNAWQMFTVLVPVDVRDEMVLALRDKGIGASVHFDPPVHTQPVYAAVKHGTSLSNTEQVACRLITLPIYPSMSLDDVDYVSDSILEFFERKGLTRGPRPAQPTA